MEIAKIKNEDVGYNPCVLDGKVFERIGSRGVVVGGDGKIALFFEENKGDYKLPGGGVEGDETPTETFKREVYEEVGCEVDEIKEIGTIVEERSNANFSQVSHVFVSKLKKDLHELHLTAKERLWGGGMLWVTPKEALKLVTECADNLKNLSDENLYHLKFMVMRDRKILEYVIENKII